MQSLNNSSTLHRQFVKVRDLLGGVLSDGQIVGVISRVLVCAISPAFFRTTLHQLGGSRPGTQRATLIDAGPGRRSPRDEGAGMECPQPPAAVLERDCAQTSVNRSNEYCVSKCFQASAQLVAALLGTACAQTSVNRANEYCASECF